MERAIRRARCWPADERFGSYWYGIDSTGTAANSLKLAGSSLNFSNEPGFSGSEIMLTNAAGPGARMFVFPNASGFFVTGPLAVFYSFVMQVSNVNNLAAGGYVCHLSD